MIALYNPNTNNPFSVQYVYGAQVFRKEIIPGYMMGFRNLTGTSQIVNLQSLTGNNVTVYDINANGGLGGFVNQATILLMALEVLLLQVRYDCYFSCISCNRRLYFCNNRCNSRRSKQLLQLQKLLREWWLDIGFSGSMYNFHLGTSLKRFSFVCRCRLEY
jgi:hypothetical protein